MNRQRLESARPYLAGLAAVVLLFWAGNVPADGGPEHQAAQAWPIELGTSGGNINDISRRYCCSGTLGAVVTDGVDLYILSNNHVLARANKGQIGEDISQPGMIDQSCGQAGALADLSAFVPLKFKSKKSIPLNQVDAAIALGRTDALSADGAILDLGPVSAATVPAYVGQAVRKSGRTTGLTAGTVAAINVTVDVGYSSSCGGASSQVARFTNQIRISSGNFSAGGDSGSLIVESGATDPTDGLPRATGLLFAGSSTSTIANPINNVLSSLGVAMIGGVTPTSAASASAVVTPGKNSKHSLDRVRTVKDRNSNLLLGIPGVVGHGISLSKTGDYVIEVYLAQDSAASRGKTPHSLDDVPVQVVVTGPIEAL